MNLLRGEKSVGDKPVKLLRVSRLALLYDVDEVVREDERDAFPLNAKLGFEVAQDVAKVDVKELTGTGSRVNERT